EDRNQLCTREAERKSVVLGAEELDDEPLHTLHDAIGAEQPADLVAMAPQTPENQKHREAHRDFVKLRRMDRDDSRRVSARGKWNAEVAREDSGGRRGRALGKLYGKRA